MSAVEQALSYAEHGWALVPVSDRSKGRERPADQDDPTPSPLDGLVVVRPGARVRAPAQRTREGAAPAAVFRLELEATPQLVYDCAHESDAERLADWLAHDPRLVRLLALADELATEMRRAA